MPIILHGTVVYVKDVGYVLRDEHDADKLGTLLERYDGKRIRMRVSIKEEICQKTLQSMN